MSEDDSSYAATQSTLVSLNDWEPEFRQQATENDVLDARQYDARTVYILSCKQSAISQIRAIINDNLASTHSRPN